MGPRLGPRPLFGWGSPIQRFGPLAGTARLPFGRWLTSKVSNLAASASKAPPPSRGEVIRVEVAGFEPTSSWFRTRRSTRLSYTSKESRRPESNRVERVCCPHSRPGSSTLCKWLTRKESNLQPTGSEPGTLPIELLVIRSRPPWNRTRYSSLIRRMCRPVHLWSKVAGKQGLEP